MSRTPDAALAALTDAAAPYLIGVRHHAPSLAAALPALLDDAKPDVLLVELPDEMQEWLPWLAHEATRAPVALAAAPGDGAGGGPAFYPFADFSPELAAVRWAARHGVPAVACDLPLADRAWAAGRQAPRVAGEPGPGLHAVLRDRVTGRPGDDLWDRLVEATAPGSPPEALRRAALLTGWALREDAAASGGVPALDLRREAWMRSRIDDATADGARAAVVVGAFHAPALLPGAAPGARPRRARTPGAGGARTPAPGRPPSSRTPMRCWTSAPATPRASGTRSGSTSSSTRRATPARSRRC